MRGPDDPAALSEVTETNNCLATSNVVEVSFNLRFVPSDVLVNAVALKANDARAGGKFSITDELGYRFGNKEETAPAAVTRYYLSSTRFLEQSGLHVLVQGSRRATDFPLPGVPRPQKPPRPGVSPLDRPRLGSNRADVELTIPASLPAGSYWVVACVSVTDVEELDARNNCRAAPTQLRVAR